MNFLVKAVCRDCKADEAHPAQWGWTGRDERLWDEQGQVWCPVEGLIWTDQEDIPELCRRYTEQVVGQQ